MKKIIISLGLVLVSLAVSFGQTNVFIPDSNFKAYLLSRTDSINVNADTAISFQEAENFKGRIDVYRKNINSMNGLDAFTNITYLHCGDNELNSLDIGSNTSLKILNCSSNYFLKILDLSKNTSLTSLQLTNTQISSLDISKNIALNYLNCSSNKLSSLDVSQNTALFFLDCSFNQISSLDLSKNTLLVSLFCNHNHLSSLNVSKNTTLMTLYCLNNQLSDIDVSKNTNLSRFWSNQNPKLTCIGISNGQNNLNYAQSSEWIKDATASYSTTPCNTTTAIEKTTNSNLTLFPNPAQNTLTIQLTESLQGTVSLIDLQGQTILSQAINDNNAQINISGVSNGVYILKVISDKATYTKQVVIAR